MIRLLEDLDVVLDIRLRGQSGLEGIALLKRNWRQVAAGGCADAVVATRARDRALVVGSWAAGFISKAETAEHVGQSYKLMAGLSSVSDNAVRRHVQGLLTLFDVGSHTEVVAAR